MGSIGTYEMLDGRMVTVDFACVKSVMKVKKKDWTVIRVILREQLRFVQSDEYTILLRDKLKQFLRR